MLANLTINYIKQNIKNVKDFFKKEKQKNGRGYKHKTHKKDILKMKEQEIKEMFFYNCKSSEDEQVWYPVTEGCVERDALIQ